MRLLPWFLLFSAAASAGERIVERAPTSFVEGGKPVTLEVVLHTPEGEGPFPTLVFHHGSTGRGDDPSQFARTSESLAVARLFNELGWLVVFPQRRGRGASDGIYDEGFTPDRSAYSCDPKIALAGLARAKRDVAEILAWLDRRADVDPRRLLIGGASRGGILSMSVAADHPGRFLGVLNFVGGWIGEGCGTAEEINTPTFVDAARFEGPTLWLYGENDPFYSVEHVRASFRAFRATGGQGELEVYSFGERSSGHAVLGHPDAWGPRVRKFVAALPAARDESAGTGARTSCCAGATATPEPAPPGMAG